MIFLRKFLSKNQWTYFTFVHTLNSWQLFIDGVIETDLIQTGLSQSFECNNKSSFNLEGNLSIILS
jgi:hypothetical protein